MIQNTKDKKRPFAGKNKKRVALLGLSADPPHRGHLEMARLLLKKKAADEVWLIPCNKHCFGKKLASPKHRWQMVKLLEQHGIKANSVELSRKGKSYAIDTVMNLKKKYTDCIFSWVVGSDIVKTKSYLKWKDWKILSAMVDFLVIPRKGYGIAKIPPEFIPITGRISDVSSTEVRKKIRLGLPIKHLVPERIKEYIERRNLYK